MRHRTPWIVGTCAAAAWGIRIRAGHWSVRDALAVAVVPALQPFTEWTVHKHLLHMRPFALGRLRVDMHAAREHRRHHDDPKAFELIFIPVPDLFALSVLLAGALFSTLPVRTALSAFASAMTMLLGYEWTHYLIHTPYKPRHAHYRRTSRAHLLHHYRNEHYWMGITTDFADRLFGTAPRRSDVPLSPTARSVL